MIRLTALAALVSVAVSTPAFAQCTDADRNALIAFDKSWGEAGTSGNAAVLKNVYADGYMTMNAVGTVDKTTTLANNARDVERNKATPQPITVPDHYVIACTAGTATITHRSTTAAPAGSSAAPTYGRSIHFLEKRGGKWEVVSSTGHALSPQQQLVYLEQDWNDAVKAHNSGWVESNYASFSTDVSSRTGLLETRAQTIESARNDKMVYDLLELSDLGIRVEGDVGIVTGINRVKGTDAQGKAFDRRVRFTDTFIKQDGRWQVWATQGTIIQ